jgi:hypothetical protein
MKDEFYIGYLPKAPKSIARTIVLSVVAIGILMSVLAFVIGNNQEKVQSNVFEFGKITELTGVLYEQPVPNLVIQVGTDITGKKLYQSVLLVGFGKFGANEIVQHFQSKTKQSLVKSLITIKGTLIYSDGKTLLELTEEEASFVKAEPLKEEEQPVFVDELMKKEITVTGEIIDAKCYFGVMNPGYGKPHMSCAIRCISGGIPPVLWTKMDDGSTDYYIVLGKDGEMINEKLLPYVADIACIKGKVSNYLDWKIIYTDIEAKEEQAIVPAGCM